MDSNTYQQGQTVTVLGNSGSLAKIGASFSGWNTVAGATGTAYTAGQTFTMGAANVTLYAQWPGTTNLGYAYVLNQYDSPGTVSQLAIGPNGALSAWHQLRSRVNTTPTVWRSTPSVNTFTRSI